MSNTPTLVVPTVNATAKSTTKEPNMSDTQKTATNGKKTKRAGLASLKKLNRGPAKAIQETFRCTEDEHNKLVTQAEKDGFGSMSDFYRAKLGLDKA